MARLNEDELRTSRSRKSGGDCGAHAKRTRLIACCADHTALAIAVPNGNGLAGERGIVVDLYRCKEGVKINVKNAARRVCVRSAALPSPALGDEVSSLVQP
jgi:hypothetical protein